ncbi:hypothetical protein [Vibrio algivorus]|uniref:Uncharacterized protein n=1 Tax=Vibrio algivorus TaxID=1667024 RepID=A0A557P6F3_9VIBR|nr:hypothetical protein [Vibrio algivorus]TVO36207.1 hypothetical protein FOF44_09860 [Vibrio algivorus]
MLVDQLQTKNETLSNFANALQNNSSFAQSVEVSSKLVKAMRANGTVEGSEVIEFATFAMAYVGMKMLEHGMQREDLLSLDSMGLFLSKMTNGEITEKEEVEDRYQGQYPNLTEREKSFMR